MRKNDIFIDSSALMAGIVSAQGAARAVAITAANRLAERFNPHGGYIQA